MAQREEIPGRPWDMEVNGPVVELDTIHGPITVNFTDGKHAVAYVGYTQYGRTPDQGGPAFTYRDHQYEGFTHVWGIGGNACQFDNNGRERECGSTDGEHTHRGWMSFRRVGSSTAAPTFQATFTASMLATVRDFTEEHPEITAVAARAKAENDYEHASAAFESAREEYEREASKFNDAARVRQAALDAEDAALAKVQAREHAEPEAG